MSQTPDDERDRLLRLLEAHGQEFMSSFELPPPLKKRKKNSNLRQTTNALVHLEERDTSGAPEGFSHIDPKQGFGHDDERAASSSRAPDVTVFSDTAIKHVKSNDTSKGSRKSFMSSKAVDIKRDILPPEGVPREHLEDERTNAQNDALLYRLLHTKLLSGSLNEELGLSHAQKEKALSGRVLELSGQCKLGKGESIVREEEHNKASKRVRDGLLRKREERSQKRLEEAKNLGNYHPILKQMYASCSAKSSKRKRERGLRMGVGRFKGGVLKLSKEEISTIAGPAGKRNRG
ncbi:hypothetical protein EDD17DRAFT_311308 [Pisolithus thermaeus]|nr:hypothetical protein EV401DRAFT_329420 [Pisolithus croceorrhizus]KAI6164783.1 hypothetical protein EDD17DRAFT_311308 [Pisolithus thermaeus]